MALSVIGAGFGRTGTLSLKGALEKLGFDPCYHMMEVIQGGLPPTDGNRQEDVGARPPVTRNEFVGPGDRDASLVVEPDGADAFEVGRRVIATGNPDLLDFDRLDVSLRLKVVDETFLEAGHCRQYFL